MSGPRRPPVTGAEVARLAGVSAATVSYVLNDTAGQTIPAATRQRVREAAAQLGYRPNAAARSLRVGRSDVVVGLVPDSRYGVTFQALMARLTELLAAFGFAFVQHSAPPDGSRMEDLLRTMNPVGVVSFTVLGPDAVRVLTAAGARVVVGTNEERELQPWELRFGAGEFGTAQAEHLRSRGHTRIGLVTAQRDLTAATEAGRSGALLRVMAGAGQTGIPVLRLPAEPESAQAELDRWLRAEPDVTAVATMDDDLAALVVSSADRLGVAVPDRLAVVGAYDFPVCTLVRPTLTTVRVDLDRLVGRFAEIIASAVRDPAWPLPPRIDVDTARVVERGST